MDVKISANSLVNESYSADSAGFYLSTMTFLDEAEAYMKDAGIIYNEEDYEKLRDFLKEMTQLMENNKKANEQAKQDILNMKKKLIENMIKTIRALNSRLYTKDSWKKSMREVERAVKTYRGGKASGNQMNSVLRQLRSAMSRLEPALRKGPTGKDREREKALSRTRRFGEEGSPYDPKNIAAKLAEAGTGSVDITVDGEGGLTGWTEVSEPTVSESV